MIKVLVTGKDSQLARCIKDVEKGYKDILFVYKSSTELDITNKDSIKLNFQEDTYNYCINCAAYTNVDKAETEQKKAILINTVGSKNLAEVCEINNTILIHISTDFVFDGKKNEPYTETDQTNPLSVYGLTKRDGEKEIQKVLSKYFIIRTSWLYSRYGSNFVKTILKLAKEKNEINVVNNQIGSPTYAIDLAVFILNIVSVNSTKYGLYNYSNKGEISWKDFAQEIVNLYKLKLKIRPVHSSYHRTIVRRPEYSVLNLINTSNVFKLNMNQWRESLRRFYSDYYK